MVGWSELILVHESQTKLLKYCNTAIGKINNYPVYEEEHHSNMEREALEKNIKQEPDYFLSDHNEDIDYECKTYFKDYEPIEDKFYGAVFSKYIEMEFTPDEDQYPDAKDIESVAIVNCTHYGASINARLSSGGETHIKTFNDKKEMLGFICGFNFKG